MFRTIALIALVLLLVIVMSPALMEWGKRLAQYIKGMFK